MWTLGPGGTVHSYSAPLVHTASQDMGAIMTILQRKLLSLMMGILSKSHSQQMEIKGLTGVQLRSVCPQAPVKPHTKKAGAPAISKQTRSVETFMPPVILALGLPGTPQLYIRISFYSQKAP